MRVHLGDTTLHVEERGGGDLALIVLHGGPGLDHTQFGPFLDDLGDDARLLLVDERGQGRSDRVDPATLTLERFAADVEELAEALGLERYVVLGHSFGAFIALQHAVDFPGRPAGTIVSSGIPSERFLAHVEENLAAFEPVELREQVTESWARESQAKTEDDVRALLSDQLPFHFADPHDPRIEEFRAGLGDAVYSPEVLAHVAANGYGGIEVESRLGEVTHPLLVLAGRQDRTCSVEAATAIAAGVPGSRLVVFEDSGHMTYVEENAAYVDAVRGFLASV
jgi:proline iminopeptidase